MADLTWIDELVGDTEKANVSRVSPEKPSRFQWIDQLVSAPSISPEPGADKPQIATAAEPVSPQQVIPTAPSATESVPQREDMQQRDSRPITLADPNQGKNWISRIPVAGPLIDRAADRLVEPNRTTEENLALRAETFPNEPDAPSLPAAKALIDQHSRIPADDVPAQQMNWEKRAELESHHRNKGVSLDDGFKNVPTWMFQYGPKKIAEWKAKGPIGPVESLADIGTAKGASKRLMPFSPVTLNEKDAISRALQRVEQYNKRKELTRQLKSASAADRAQARRLLVETQSPYTKEVAEGRQLFKELGMSDNAPPTWELETPEQMMKADQEYLRRTLPKIAERVVRGDTSWARIAEAVSVLPKYMAEFMIAGKLAPQVGAAGSVAQGASNLATISALTAQYGLEEYADRVTPTGVITDKGVKILFSGERPISALWKSVAGQVVRTAAEMSGEKIIKVASGAAAGTPLEKIVAVMSKRLGNTPFHGVAPEVLEEEFERATRTVLGIDDADLSVPERFAKALTDTFDGQRLAEETAIMIPFALLGLGGNIMNALAGRGGTEQTPAPPPTTELPVAEVLSDQPTPAARPVPVQPAAAAEAAPVQETPDVQEAARQEEPPGEVAGRGQAVPDAGAAEAAPEAVAQAPAAQQPASAERKDTSAPAVTRAKPTKAYRGEMVPVGPQGKNIARIRPIHDVMGQSIDDLIAVKQRHIRSSMKEVAQSTGADKRMARSQLKGNRKVLADLQRRKALGEQTEKAAEYLSDLVYLAEDQSVAESYAKQREQVSDVLVGPKPAGYDPSIASYDIAEHNQADVADAEQAGDALHMLGFSSDAIDRLGVQEGDPVFTLFRGDRGRKVVPMLRKRGVQSVRYSEGGTTNIVILDQSVAKRGNVRRVSRQPAPAAPAATPSATKEAQRLGVDLAAVPHKGAKAEPINATPGAVSAAKRLGVDIAAVKPKGDQITTTDVKRTANEAKQKAAKEAEPWSGKFSTVNMPDGSWRIKDESAPNQNLERARPFKTEDAAVDSIRANWKDWAAQNDKRAQENAESVKKTQEQQRKLQNTPVGKFVTDNDVVVHERDSDSRTSEQRVVFGPVGATIETNATDAVGLPTSDGVYAVHVGDADYWTDRLAKDYDRDARDAHTVEIKVGPNDVLVNDVQYLTDPETGDKADSGILLTTRKTLQRGVDFIVDGEHWGIPATPGAASLAKRLGVDLATVQPKGDQITTTDVKRAANEAKQKAAAEKRKAKPAKKAKAPTKAEVSRLAGAYQFAMKQYGADNMATQRAEFAYREAQTAYDEAAKQRTVKPKPAQKADAPTPVVEEHGKSATVSVPQAKGGITTKQQKAYLLDEIDAAMEAAPNQPKEWNKARIRGLGQAELDLRKKQVGTVRIEVPDDGVFTVLNTKEALETFRKNTKKMGLSTKPAPVPGAYSKPTAKQMAAAEKAQLELQPKPAPAVQGTGGAQQGMGETAAQKAQREAEENGMEMHAGIPVDFLRITQPHRADNVPDVARADDPDVERRLAAAHGIAPRSVAKRVKDAFSAAWSLTRPRRHIPKRKGLLAADEHFRLFNEIPQVQSDETNRTVAAILYGLGPKQKALFERHEVAANLLESVKQGQPLRFGFADVSSVEAYAKKLSDAANKVPEVKKAIATRRAIVKELTQELVDNGLISEDATKDTEAYYHQQVLSYMESLDYAKRISKSGVRQKKRSFQKKRVEGPGEMSEAFDYNTDYVEAEATWMAEARIEIAKKKWLDGLAQMYDKAAEFKKTAKNENTSLEQVALDNDYDLWQPQPGNVFYRAMTVPQKIVEQLQAGTLSTLSQEDLKSVLAMGGQHTQLALPKEIVAQLDSMTKPKPERGLGMLSAEAMRMWKVWTLLNPKRAVQYNLRNLTGDLDPVISGAPAILLEMPTATGDLVHYYRGGLGMSDAMRSARDLGVINSTLTQQEIPHLKDLVVFKRFYATNPTGIAKLPSTYFETVRKYTDFRESLLRYAAFLHYRKKLAAGPLSHYGGASRQRVMEIKNRLGIDAAAAHMSRNLLGDYGNLSELGTWIRKQAIPFWSWMEINTKRIPMMTVNAARSGFESGGVKAGIAKGGAVAAAQAAKGTVFSAIAVSRIAALYGVFWLWNNLRFPDEEKELGTYERSNPHIILGRNDDNSINIFRNVGALGDFFEWFGINDLVNLYPKYKDNQISGADLATEVSKAPVNKIIQGFRPDVKALFELVGGASYFPDAFHPRAKGRAELAAGVFGLEDEYKEVKGRLLHTGERARPHYWQRLIGTTDPRRNVHGEIMQLRDDFLRQEGRERPTVFSQSKIKHLRDAAFNNDFDAFVEARKRYVRDGGTWKKYKQSIGYLDPLYGRLNDTLKKKFTNEFLTDMQREKLSRATSYGAVMKERMASWWSKAGGSQSVGSSTFPPLSRTPSWYTREQ